jgi:CBS domain-containing protein
MNSSPLDEPMKSPATRAASARTVREVMEPHVVTVVPEMTVRELVETFREEHIRGAPVLGRSGKVIGMVSESDVLRHALGPAALHAEPAACLSASASLWECDGGEAVTTMARSRAMLAGCDLGRVRVAEIMGPVGPTFAPGDELQALSRFFAADGVQRVAVIENDILLGIVTPADVLRGLVSPR